MKNYISISTAGSEKLPLLWATLTSLFPQLPYGTHVRVNYNSTDDGLEAVNDNKGLRTLEKLAEVGGVTLSVVVMPQSSVAQMFAGSCRTAMAEGYDSIIKIDDDCIVTGLSAVFSLLERNTFVTFNFWDIENTRGYDDWFSKTSVKDLDSLVEKFGPRTVWCHRWADATPDHVFTYPTDSVLNPSMYGFHLTKETDLLIAELELIPKGQRGMDKVVGQFFSNTRRVHSLFACATHLGVYRPQLDGTYWTSFQEGAEIHHAAPTLNADGQTTKRLFVGKEVEHTAYFGHKTLFVQGLVSNSRVMFVLQNQETLEDRITHVYLGAGGLSQADPKLIPLLTEEGYKVTIEAVLNPEAASSYLAHEDVVLVIPVFNEGRPQPGAVQAACLWYSYLTSDADSFAKFKDRVFFKLDTKSPSVLIFPVVSAWGITLKEAYTGDVTLEHDSMAAAFDLHSWID